jgi:hypothetical protein
MADGTVSFNYFRRALKALNPLVHLEVESQTHRGCMVYLRIPRHPESNPVTGLWEVLAVPSPIYYKRMPKHDVELNGKWVRGWSTFFKAVKKMRDPNGRIIFNPTKVKALFNKPYDNFDSRKFKADLAEANLSPEARNYKKLRGALRAY